MTKLPRKLKFIAPFILALGEELNKSVVKDIYYAGSIRELFIGWTCPDKMQSYPGHYRNYRFFYRTERNYLNKTIQVPRGFKYEFFLSYEALCMPSEAHWKRYLIESFIESLHIFDTEVFRQKEYIDSVQLKKDIEKVLLNLDLSSIPAVVS